MLARFGQTIRIPSRLGSTHDGGLSEVVAMARLKAEGMNELPVSNQRNFFVIALGAIREAMFLLLTAAAVVNLVLGDVSDAKMLLGFL